MWEFKIIQALGCEPCQFSVFTETVVDTCPETQAELIKRKAEKKCEIWAKLQNCTEPGKFKYHCAMNEHESKLIEVCAKEHRINGRLFKFIVHLQTSNYITHYLCTVMKIIYWK